MFEPIKNDDELYTEAMILVIIAQKASTSYVQRFLQVGYNRAATIIERLEKEGIVSAANTVGKREVLKTREHLEKSATVVAKIMEISKATGIDPDKISAAAFAAVEKNKERPASVGHNSAGEKDTATDTGGVSGQRLKAFIERIERLEEEKKGLGDDVKDIYAEAKAVGYDTKTIRKVIRLRKMDPEKRQEEESLLELYAAAIGLQLSLDV